MSKEFEGDSLTDWVKHFRLSEKCLQCLTETLGLEKVQDLSYVYEDEVDMLKQVENACKRIEYRRFLDARNFTKILQKEEQPPGKIPSNVTASSGLVSSRGALDHAVNMPPPPPPPPAAAAAASNLLPPPNVMPPLAPSGGSSTSIPSSMDRKIAEAQRQVDIMNAKIARQERKQQQLIEIERTLLARKEDARRFEQHNRLSIKRAEKIRLLEEEICKAASLDVAIVLDCTRSMKHYLEHCKSQIKNFVKDIERLHPNGLLRLAFVAYRDHSNGEKRIESLGFTNQLNEFQEFMNGLVTLSDVDEAEDVLGGLETAKELDWHAQTKILYHIADAPCHGLEFHPPTISDKYKEGCPNGLNAGEILQSLRERQIRYYFGQIKKEKTKMMIRRFNELAGGGMPSYIQVTDMNHGNMMDVITQSVSLVYSDSISSSSRTDESKGAKKKEVIIDESVPIWEDQETEEVQRYSMSVDTTVEDLIQGLFDNGEDKCINDFPDDHNPQIKVATSPFAQGSMRAAYYGLLMNIDGSETPVILKEALYINPTYLTKQMYANYLSCHRTAKLFANQFNEVKPAGCARIEFCEASILQFMTRRGQPYLIMESAITDKFEKYSNNSGYCARNPTYEGVNHDAVQAFSHWTYCFSEEQMMVVDCQGGFNRATNTFLLTDPAVHFVDVALFGSTNMGGNGFRKFFSNHVCNPICAAMKLRTVTVAVAVTAPIAFAL